MEAIRRADANTVLARTPDDGPGATGRAVDGARPRGDWSIERDDAAGRRASRQQRACIADNSWPAFEAAVAEGADAIECDVQATRDGDAGHPPRSGDRRIAAWPRCTAAELDARRSRARSASPICWRGRSARTIDLLVEVKDPDAAEAGRANDRGERVARPDRRRGLPRAGAGRGQRRRRPDVRTSFMMGSVVGRRGARAPRRCVSRGRRAPVLGTRARASASAAGRARRSIGCAAPAWRSRCGTRSAKTNCVRWSRCEPDAICTNTPAALRRIVDRRSCAAGTWHRVARSMMPRSGKLKPIHPYRMTHDPRGGIP